MLGLWFILACTAKGPAGVANDRIDDDETEHTATDTGGIEGADTGTDCDPQIWFVDGDGDGYGIEVEACEDPGGTVDIGGDCDDDNSWAYPGADEYCDKYDNDCDGVADNDPVDPASWYMDADVDGYGDDDSVVLACSAPGDGWTERGGDCNDSDSTIRPGGHERCDGVDSNCDGLVEPEDAAVCLEAGAEGFLLGESSDIYKSNFGAGLGADDLDGDGVADVVVAAPGWTDAYRHHGHHITAFTTDDFRQGRVFVMPGPVTTPVDVPAGEPVEITSAEGRSFLGIGMVVGADLLGDGAPVLAISDHHGDSSDHVYLISDLSLFDQSVETAASVTLQGSSTLELRSPVFLAGELAGGDGQSDLLFYANDGGVPQLRVLSGPLGESSDLDDPTATIALDSWTAGVALIPDATGDGVDGVMLSQGGAVYVFEGPLSGDFTLDDADGSVLAPELELVYWDGAVASGDIDGDGAAEVLIAGGSEDAGLSYAAFVLEPPSELGGSTDDASVQVQCDVPDVGFARAIHVPGDLDGDGNDDLLVGSTGSDAWGFLGPLSGTLGQADAEFFVSDGGENARMGSSAVLADADGDGADDLLISAVTHGNRHGAVYLIPGAGF